MTAIRTKDLPARIPWFQPDDYLRIFEIANDPGEVPFDYDQWRNRTEYEERLLKRRGRLVVRVIVDPDRLLAWCAANAIEPSYNAVYGFMNENVFPRRRTAG